MRINFSKDVFSKTETKFIIARLKEAAELGFIRRRSERNAYLMASYQGVEEKGISPKWNIKIYTYNRRRMGHSLVCVDKLVLARLTEGDYDSFTPPDLRLLRIDDAGWGFPMCGVMVGVSDERRVETATVPVEYFRRETRNGFETKQYLDKYADLAIGLLEGFDATPETHRIEICSGYVNQPLREKLRRLGYDVRVVEIKGLLQERLEALYKEYVVREIGSDIYYDPKDMKKAEIPKRYYECLDYGNRHCPHLLKNGWRALEGWG